MMSTGNQGKKRAPHSELTKRKIGEKNKISQLGKKLSEQTKERMSLSRMNEKNPLWKGDKVGYFSLHTWLQRKFGKANVCENCGDEKAKKYDWANITGDYSRERKNWKMLCSKCHHKLDDNINKGWLTRKVVKK